MKKIICFVGSMDAGGAETFLMKIYRAIDKNKYQFDFIVNVKKECFYDAEIKKMGGHIYYSPPKSQKPFENIRKNLKIIENTHYDAALRMTSHSLGTIDLLVAKFAGVKKLILRSTNAGNTENKFSFVLHKFFLFLPKYIPNIKLAPSKLAAEYLWGGGCLKNGNVKILNNGIPLGEYVFSQKMRNKKRLELGINDNFVIGHIGRFNFQKNHQFLLRIFAEIYKKDNNVRLLLIGKGELEGQIRVQIEKLKIREAVIFTGLRHDVPGLLMAMDVFVLPSYFEGMPNVVIEAQMTGLRCLVSDKVDSGVKITNFVRFLPISRIEEWTTNILHFNKLYNRNIPLDSLLVKSYDINIVAQHFLSIVFKDGE